MTLIVKFPPCDSLKHLLDARGIVFRTACAFQAFQAKTHQRASLSYGGALQIVLQKSFCVTEDNFSGP
jgi:hypothetical protein